MSIHEECFHRRNFCALFTGCITPAVPNAREEGGAKIRNAKDLWAASYWRAACPWRLLILNETGSRGKQCGEMEGNTLWEAVGNVGIEWNEPSGRAVFTTKLDEDNQSLRTKYKKDWEMALGTEHLSDRWSFRWTRNATMIWKMRMQNQSCADSVSFFIPDQFCKIKMRDHNASGGAKETIMLWRGKERSLHLAACLLLSLFFSTFFFFYHSGAKYLVSGPDTAREY